MLGARHFQKSTHLASGQPNDYLIPVREKSISEQKGKSSQKARPKLATACTDYSPGLMFA